MSSAKTEVRQRVLAVRRRRPAAERDAAGEAIGVRLLALLGEPDGARAHRRVAAYVPAGSEPGHGAFLDAAMLAGVEVLLPVLRDDLDLDWASHAGADTLAPGGVRPGLAEPTGPRLGRDAIGTVSLVIAPALAVSRDGARLGYGGGSYDRALASLDAAAASRGLRSRVAVVAVVWDEEVLASLPREAHDRRVDAIVTPLRTIACASPDRRR